MMAKPLAALLALLLLLGPVAPLGHAQTIQYPSPTTLPFLTITQGPLLLPDGTAAAPSLARDAQIGTGLSFGSETINFNLNQGTHSIRFTSSMMAVAKDYSLRWSGTSNQADAASTLYLSQAAPGHAKITTDGSTLGTLSALNFTRTDTASVTGITMAGTGDVIGPGAGVNPRIIFNSAGNQSAGALQLDIGAHTNTSGATAAMGAAASFTPASGSGSWALFHLNPTINGTSTGTAYGLGIASKTNTLTGGTIKPFSIGGTTTDLFTGYTRGFEVDHVGSWFSAKMTASASAPGADGAKFEVVCGTNAGTVKLIMYGGTSGTATTIVDNVGAGATGC